MATSSTKTRTHTVTERCTVCGTGIATTQENARHKRNLGITVLCIRHGPNHQGWLPRWAR